jgi:hypothetical protein
MKFLVVERSLKVEYTRRDFGPKPLSDKEAGTCPLSTGIVELNQGIRISKAQSSRYL